VDLAGGTVTQYRDPGPGRYRTVRTERRGGEVGTPQLPGVTLSVDDILG
jgi:Uma2 family endonuclease